LLPPVLAANIAALRARSPDHPMLARYAWVGRALTASPGLSDADAIGTTVRFTSDLARALNIPPLAAFRLAETDLPYLVALAANVQDGRINPHKVGGGRKLYVMYTKRTYADFTLACDFKVSPGCNSGIFLRAGDPADPVQTGLEIQVFDSGGKTAPDKYDCG